MKELNESELRKVEGGIFGFVLGAIVGGIIYDCWKAGVSYVASGQYEGGSLHGQWGPR